MSPALKDIRMVVKKLICLRDGKEPDPSPACVGEGLCIGFKKHWVVSLKCCAWRQWW